MPQRLHMTVRICLFICRRNPIAHSWYTNYPERLVICPECGGAGETRIVEVEMQTGIP